MTSRRDSSPRRSFAGLAAGIVGLVLGLADARTQVFSWDHGAGTSDWSDANNWNPNTSPNSSGATAVFNSTPSGPSTIDQDMGTIDLGAILFVSGAPSRTIEGDTIKLHGSFFGLGVINDSGNTQTLETDFILQTAQTWLASDGDLIIDSSVNTNWQALTLSSNAGQTITIDGTLNGGGALTKTGDGTVELTTSNSGWSGTWTIQNGVLAVENDNSLGSSTWGNTIQSGGTLALRGSADVTENSISVVGTGEGGMGAIYNESGNSKIDAAVTLTGDATFTSAANKLTFNQSSGNVNLGGNTLTLNGAGDFDFKRTILGSGGVTINMTGANDRVTYSGSSANTYNGTTTVQNGELFLSRSSGTNSIAGDLVIGDGIGASRSAEVRLTQNNQIVDYQTVSILSDGVFDLNNRNEGIRSLTMSGGAIVDLGSGDLSLLNAGGKFTFNGTSGTAVIDGTSDSKLIINGYSYEFDIADGTASSDVTIDTRIEGGAILRKTGTGTLELKGGDHNTYNGLQIDGGTVILNQNDNTDAVGNGTIVVNNTGTLLLQSDEQIDNAVNMTLNGGTFSTGSTVGYEETLGKLTLTANSSINLGTGAHDLIFASSSNADSVWWTGGTTLTIYGWTGVPNSGHIYFGNSASGLSASQLAQITFDGYAAGAMILGSGEIVPVSAIPEPEAIAGGLLLCAGILWMERRRIRKLLSAVKAPSRC